MTSYEMTSHEMTQYEIRCCKMMRGKIAKKSQIAKKKEKKALSKTARRSLRSKTFKETIAGLESMHQGLRLHYL